MVKTASTMLPLGTSAPAFALMNVDDQLVSLADFQHARALLIVFMCNHCPYVKHVAPELVRLHRDYAPLGLQMIGINSNDANAYPEDSHAKMKEESQLQGYAFPYLYDPTQEVAKAYRAACTPDFFLFDAQRQLVYRGQLDDSRPKSDKPLTGRDLRLAIDATLAGNKLSEPQRPSIGCNIKWLPGQEPDYFGQTSV